MAKIILHFYSIELVQKERKEISTVKIARFLFADKIGMNI